MGRRPLIRDGDGAYHVCARTNNQDWFSLPLSTVWNIFLKHLSEKASEYRTEIHTFCLMSNHYHLLLSTPELNLDEMMRDMNTKVSREVARESNRINHVFGGRYKWSHLQDAFALAYVYKYILRNPIRAGICQRVEDYPFSAISLKNAEVPIVERIDPIWSLMIRNPEQRLHWLNLPTAKEEEELITKALRRFEFQFSRGNDVRNTLEALLNSYGVSRSDRNLFSRKIE